MAHKYMSYSRDEGGLITRNHTVITVGDVAEYDTRETLMGWPERYVFWRFLANGSAVGIAPMTERVLKTLRHYSSMDGRKLRPNNACCTSATSP